MGSFYEDRVYFVSPFKAYTLGSQILVEMVYSPERGKIHLAYKDMCG